MHEQTFLAGGNYVVDTSGAWIDMGDQTSVAVLVKYVHGSETNETFFLDTANDPATTTDYTSVDNTGAQVASGFFLLKATQVLRYVRFRSLKSGAPNGTTQFYAIGRIY